MYQDKDQMRANNQLMKSLFPKNPIGRDVIGYPAHLKNPSMVNIMNFYHTWYVPNNMAVIISGDIDFDKTIKLVDSTFGRFPSKELPEIKEIKEDIKVVKDNQSKLSLNIQNNNKWLRIFIALDITVLIFIGYIILRDLLYK